MDCGGAACAGCADGHRCGAGTCDPTDGTCHDCPVGTTNVRYACVTTPDACAATQWETRAQDFQHDRACQAHTVCATGAWEATNGPRTYGEARLNSINLRLDLDPTLNDSWYFLSRVAKRTPENDYGVTTASGVG